MATVVERDQIVALLTEEFAAIAELCDGFDDAAWATPTCLPGWSVKDVVSHLIGTESVLLGEKAPEVDVSHLTHMKNPPAVNNEVWVESMRGLSGAEVLDRFRAVTAKRLTALDAMTQADFDAPSWTPVGPDETYGRFMRVRHYDCFLHEHDIRAAVGAPDRDERAHVASALTEPATALGYIVGKKASMPAGARVRITITGPVDTEYHVAVGERAQVVASLDGGPTVGISLPALLFLRLTGGREDATPHLDHDVVLEGDRSLATQLATHLAFTI